MDAHHAREALIDAAIDALASPSPPAMPLRAVAAAAGLTTGAVQHHFGNRHGLLLAAVDRQSRAIAERLAAAEAAHPPGGDRVRALLRVLLPLDETSVREARMVQALVQFAAADEELAAAVRDRYRQLVELLAGGLPGGRRDAALLISVIDGASTDILLGIVDGDEALALVEHFLTLLER